MQISLTRQQAVVALDLLRKYMNLSELTRGEVISRVDETTLEWDEDTVEITLPD